MLLRFATPLRFIFTCLVTFLLHRFSILLFVVFVDTLLHFSLIASILVIFIVISTVTTPFVF